MTAGYDVLVAGAGPAGAVAAYVLARAGRRVLMVDDDDSSGPKVGESLPGAARPLLRDLGLDEAVGGNVHLHCNGNAFAWGTDELESTDSIRDPHGVGWHLDRRRFDADLRRAARRAGATLRRARLGAVHRRDVGWNVEISDGQTLEVKWLIDATGRAAVVSRGAGASRIRDDTLIAFSCHTRSGAGDTDTRTIVEAIPGGWWYTARVPCGRMTVLHADADRAAELRQIDGWLAALNRTRHVRRFVGCGDLRADLAVHDAGGARMDRFGGDGWIAVGDAALAFDPLSSQGILTALHTGMLAGRCIDDELAGHAGTLASYCSRLESIRAAYLRHRAQIYRSEGRWPDAPFWARRHRLAG